MSLIQIILPLSLVLSVYALIVVLIQINSKPGSDHYGHLNRINNIKKNRNRFIKRNESNLCNTKEAYPQFYHWILALLPSTIIERYYRVFAIVIDLLQLISFLIFAFTIYPFIQTDLNLERFMLFGGLIFIFTPFRYSIWNAKNSGLSARGFGLFQGQIYLYFISWYYLSGNIVFFLGAFLMGFIIIISSQFAMQFVLFSSLFFALFFKNPLFLLIPVFALLMFYLIMPEIACNYIKGQIIHKTLYYKYIAEKFILRNRYSIWRDFVWDFWIKAKEDFKKSILYIYQNSLVSVIFGFPFFTLLVLCFFVDNKVLGLIMADRSLWILGIPVVVSSIIFLLTSFRKTRFLGEPERYMEFCTPQISILGGVFFGYSSFIAYIVLGISFVLVIGQFILGYLIIKYGYTKTQHYKNFMKIFDTLCKIERSEVKEMRIFSNNSLLNKTLQIGNWKVLNINVTSLYTGQFHFKDIFPVEYPFIAKDVILPLIKEVEIGWFILDTNILPDYYDILEDNDVWLKEEIRVDMCRIFKVCSKI